METKVLILSDLAEVASAAYRNLSFSSEKRGEMIVKDYSEELEKDLALIPEQFREDYTVRYKRLLRKWLYSLGNCASPMITGPSNFPVERMKKRSRWADNHYSAFRDWRNARLKGIEKAVLKARTPDQVVDDQWQVASKSLYESAAVIMNIDQGIETSYNRRLFVNSITRLVTNFAETGRVELTARSIELLRRLNDQAVKPILAENNSVWGLLPTAKEAREKRESDKQKDPDEYTQNDIRVVYNHSEDRVQLFFTDKAHAMRYKLAGHLRGWIWSPRNTCWQRKLTGNGKYSAKQIVNIKL